MFWGTSNLYQRRRAAGSPTGVGSPLIPRIGLARAAPSDCCRFGPTAARRSRLSRSGSYPFELTSVVRLGTPPVPTREPRDPPAGPHATQPSSPPHVTLTTPVPSSCTYIRPNRRRPARAAARQTHPCQRGLDHLPRKPGLPDEYPATWPSGQPEPTLHTGPSRRRLALANVSPPELRPPFGEPITRLARDRRHARRRSSCRASDAGRRG